MKHYLALENKARAGCDGSWLSCHCLEGRERQVDPCELNASQIHTVSPGPPELDSETLSKKKKNKKPENPIQYIKDSKLSKISQ